MSEYSLLLGDAVQVMRGLPANSVQMVCTSPPYFGLRDYQTATWEGGDAECDHSTGKKARNDGGVGGRNGPTSQAQDGGELYYRDLCGKCGARRIDNQIGLESSPEAYVAKLVEVFREVRRLLHPSGVVFLNLGDSYNGSGGAGGDYSEGGLKEGQPKYPGRRVNGLKPKDLCMIPARVAIALQDDGWWLRQEIVWHKRAPMPESVQDRCTRAHEMVYMLAKNANYFYDAEAIAEPATTGTDLGILRTRQQNLDRNDYNRRQEAIDAGIDSRNGNPSGTRNKRSVWTLGPEQFTGWLQTSHLQPVERHDVSDDTNCKVSPDCPVHAGLFDWAATDSYDVRVGDLLSRTSRKRSRRAPKPSFGSVPTDQKRGAGTVVGNSDLPHLPYSLFATDHSNGSHKTAPDPVTSQPYNACDETSDHTDDTQAQLGSDTPSPHIPSSNTCLGESASTEALKPLSRNAGTEILSASHVTYGVPPECTCSFYHEITENTSHFATMPTKLVEPCVLAGSKVGDTVLDPFCGSGTTGYVALRHHRRFIGIDLNESYISLAHRRIQQSQPLLFTLEA